MTPRTVLSMTAALTFALATGAVAQGTTKMNLRPESQLTLTGGSNVHGWSCKGSDFKATVELDSTYATQPLTAVAAPIQKVVVMIPVKNVKCGKSKMDENMYKALKAEQFPEIRYELLGARVDPAHATPDGFVAVADGRLTVSGETKQLQIPLTVVRLVGGQMKGTGSVAMLMTDFGIKPPTALMGTMRTKNEISVSFEVLLDRSAVAALTQQP